MEGSDLGVVSYLFSLGSLIKGFSLRRIRVIGQSNSLKCKEGAKDLPRLSSMILRRITDMQRLYVSGTLAEI